MCWIHMSNTCTESQSYTCKVIYCLCKPVTFFYSLMHTFSPFFVQLKPEHLRTTMIPPERIQQFIDSNMPESVIVVCFCPPSFFSIITHHFSPSFLSYNPTILCFSLLPYVSAIFFFFAESGGPQKCTEQVQHCNQSSFCQPNTKVVPGVQ